MVRVPTMGLYGTGDVALAEDQMTRSADWVERPWRYERLPGIGHWPEFAVSRKRLGKAM